MDITISKFGPGRPMILRRINGRIEFAMNERELARDAMNAIEPELRRRWSLYWQSCAARAAMVANAKSCDEMMDTIQRPDEYYACPDWLAAKALWPTSNEATPQRVIEAAKETQCSRRN